MQEIDWADEHGAGRGRDWAGRGVLGLTVFGLWTQQEAEMDMLTPEAAVHAGNAWGVTLTTNHSGRHERGGEESASYEAVERGRGRIVRVGSLWPTKLARRRQSGLFLKEERQFSRRGR